MFSKLTAIILLFASSALGDIPNTITIVTECKTCPYDLCTNKLVYENDNKNMNLTCWTEGSQIMDTNTWLKTRDNCYVNEWDLEEYADTTDLPYCGRIPQRITTATGRTHYYSECYNTPHYIHSALKYYKYGIDLALTCVARNVTGDFTETMGDRNWFKTKSNCYVNELTMWPVRDEDDLDDCGPIPQEIQRTADATDTPTPTAVWSSIPVTPTPSVSSTAAPKALSEHHPRGASKLDRRFLYNTTIGEEYVNCTSNFHAADRGRTVRVYEFNQTVIPQCGSVDDTTGTPTIMLFTTDFCWIKDDETWIQMQASLFRSLFFPHCEKFVDETT